MLYAVPIIILFLWFYSPKTWRINQNVFFRNRNRNFILAVVIISIFSCLKDPFIYPDNISYYEWYKSLAFDDDSLNIGYIIYNHIVSFISNNNHFVFFAISAIAINVGYCKYIDRNSPHIWLALFLYILINYYPSFFLLRQYLAMPFVFMAFYYIIERKLVGFIVCSLLAYSFHTMSLCIVPMYFVYSLKPSRLNFILIAGGTVAGCLGLVAIGNYLSSYFDAYSHYLSLEVEDAAWSRAFMKIYIFGVYVYALGHDCYKVGINRIVFYSMLMCIIICVGAVNLFGVYRMRDFFSIADIIGVPLIWCYAKQYNGFRKYTARNLALVYIALLVYSFNSFVQGDNMHSDYQLFWNGKPIYWSK